MYKIKDNEFVDKAYGILHKGELEVVVAALENNIKVVIIDEKTARNFAETLNLKPLGIVGILRLAKEKGKIKEMKKYLDELIKNKYRISKRIYNKILTEAKEL